VKIVALVPMRHHSQRVPQKNFRVIAGKPLFHFIIQTLQHVPEIGEIVVDTDSGPIRDGLEAEFPTVHVIDRPLQLRADAAPMNEILLHDTAQVDAEFYLQTHSTNPLLRPETVSRAIQTFLARFPANDSLFGVTRLQTRLYDASGRPLNHDPRELVQTQELQPVYEENSCVYLFTRDNLARYHHRIGVSPHLFEIEAEEAWDIDDELDLAICEFLLQRRPSRGSDEPGSV